MHCLQEHELHIKRCLVLARKALGKVAPNPMVGCVITKGNRVVAEGYHQNFGEAHAEVNAIKNLPRDIDPKYCTLYVNLEPCNHYGKTPPCSHAIVQAGFKKVVVGMSDPFKEVNGSGLKHLQSNGVEVIEGVLEKECEYLNRRFITYITKERPYIILKWAECVNGFMGKEGEKVQISHWDATKLNHKWRGEEAAILVGKNTYLIDKPKLDARFWNNNNPQKWLAWGKSKIPKINDSWNVWPNENIEEMVKKMAAKGVQSVIVEGGARLLNAFIEAELYDEVRVIKSRHFRIQNGIVAPHMPALKYKTMELIKDQVFIGTK